MAARTQRHEEDAEQPQNQGNGIKPVICPVNRHAVQPRSTEYEPTRPEAPTKSLEVETPFKACVFQNGEVDERRSGMGDGPFRHIMIRSAVIVAKLLPRSFGESVAEYQTKQITIMLADATGESLH